ncbi:intracellular protein transport protein USO1-like [Telopea speciosissima]|uniref:intracellular protein transport protein USO1-like n=1 Tax=Telopea speciosissima TaxID=54955 RepID=UPI001CC40D1F|nr:intracellular protein transport protein USO1-like [Telopea speciosissima]
MASGEGSSGKALHFDGTNYAFWKNRMETYLGSLGYHVWASVLNEYIMTGVASTDNQEKKKYENNSRAMHVIKGALIDSEFVKMMECKSAKQLWDMLKSIHEGDAKIKEAKLQVYRAQFEGLKMLNEENIEDYMLRVNGVVKSIRGLGESLIDSVVVKKILRSLPDRLESKVSAVEEAKDLEVLSLDELHGNFTAYEMRKGKGKSVDKDAAFKSNDTSEEESEDESDDDVDDHTIFMAFEEKEDESPKTFTTSEDEEGEVNFKEEFRAALKELKKERKKVKQVSQNLKEQEQSVLQLKKQADESKKILEDLEEKLSQKTIECTKLESENLSLKAKLEEETNILVEYFDFQKEIDALKAKVAEFENDSSIHDIETSSQVHPSSKKLDEILSSQRSTHNKFGLGFVGESSKSAKGKGKGTAQNPITVKDKRVEKNQTPPHKTNHARQQQMAWPGRRVENFDYYYLSQQKARNVVDHRA